MTDRATRIPHRERMLVVGATIWSALLVPMAFVLPVESAPFDPLDPRAYQTGAMESLVSVNGHRILLVVVIPLIVSIATGALLVIRERLQWALAGWLAWIASIGLLAAGVLGAVTFLIGVYVLPSGILLVACCGSLRGRRQIAAQQKAPNALDG